MELVYVVIAIAGAAFAGRAVRSPYVDGDLFWQKHLGAYVLAHHALPSTLGSETFTAAGAPWTPQEWLIGIAASLAVTHGVLWVLAIAAAAAVASALLLTVRRARAWGVSPAAMVFCAGLLAIGLEGSFGIRAQVFAWPLFVALLWCLDSETPAIFLALPIVALWANLHASAMLAVPIVWIDAAASPFTRGLRSPQTGQRVLLALLVPFATLATPLGIALPLYAVALLHSPIRSSINEWQPIALHHDFFWAGVAPMLLIAACFARSLLRERPRDVAWAAVLTVMAIGAVRNVALLGFVLAPLAARGIDRFASRFAWWPPDPLRTPGARRWALTGAFVAAAIVFAVTLRSPAANDAWEPPVATLRNVAARPGEHRLFCYDFTVCSVALDYPNVRVFMDGRADPYPVRVWSDFNAIRKTSAGWHDRLDGYRIDAAIVKRGDKLDRALARERAWMALPVSDRCCRAYVRRNASP